MAAGGRRWILALAILAGVIFIVDAWRYAGYQLDDSFITFRYARSLVEGHGLVFNPGERVEGYTNLLFVLISSGFIALGLDPLAGTTIVTALASVATLVLTVLLYREVARAGATEGTDGLPSTDPAPPESGGPRGAPGEDPSRETGPPRVNGVARPLESADRASLPGSLLATGLLLTSGAFAYWSVVSMETMLFTALLAACLLLLLRTLRTGHGGLALSIPFVLLALTRPEGTAAGPLALGLAAVMESRRRGSWRPLRVLAPASAMTAVSIAALFAWRLAYYGRLVPNTFHAKVTGGEGQLLTGLAYLGDWSLASPVLALALLAPLALASPRIRARLGAEHPVWLLWAIALFMAASNVMLGGDSMPFFRFFVPVMPVLGVVAAAVTMSPLVRPSSVREPEGVSPDGLEGDHAPGEREPSRLRLTASAARWLVIAAVLVSAIASHVTIQPYRAFVAHRTAVVGSEVGRWFAERLRPGALMAINTVGAIPWESRLPTIDMLGLTDAAIASRPVYVASAGWAGHRRGWGAYVMGRRPAAILWYNSAGASEPFYLGDRELAADPYFRFFYRMRRDRLPMTSGAADLLPEDGQAPLSGMADSGGHPTGPGEEGGDPNGVDPNDDGAPGRPGREDEGGGASRTGRPPARVGSARVLARFPGYSFGFHPSGVSVAPELGVRAIYRETPVPHTTFVEHPVTVHWFEPEPRDAALWPLREKHGPDVEAFVEEAAAAWQAAQVEPPPAEPGARALVEGLCEEARKRVSERDFEAARALLARAAELNARVRMPIVYQYIANVAVMTGDLLAAIPAQKEALRLAPGNRLYAQNLANLLRMPFPESRARSE